MTPKYDYIMRYRFEPRETDDGRAVVEEFCNDRLALTYGPMHRSIVQQFIAERISMLQTAYDRQVERMTAARDTKKEG